MSLIHQHAASAAARVHQLQAAGFAAEHRTATDSTGLRRLAEKTPDVFVVDLDRLPSHGREFGVWLRRRKATRRIPLVFAGGTDPKVFLVRRLLPDAKFCSWEDVGPAIIDAVANPPVDPAVPKSQMAGYSGTPLPRKLGIKEGSTLALIDSPPDFARTLGDLPPRVRVDPLGGAGADLTIWFCRSRADLTAKIPDVRERIGGSGRLWIAWQKQASGAATDVRQTDVRAAGLGCGLVDFKVCAIDRTWSGLQFAPRRP